MEKKKVFYKDQCPGYCYVPVSSEEDMHEFGLYDEKGTEVSTGYFANAETVMEKAVAYYGCDKVFTVKDLTEEEYLAIALSHRNFIKKLHPSFKKSNIILDMTEKYISRCPEDWYTFIPFEYNGEKWCIRETAGTEWVERVGA